MNVGRVEFRLLGEVTLDVAGRVLDVGTPRQQAVLAALLVDAGRPVPVEALIDRVWGEDPPDEPRNALYSHVSRIRRLLRQAADRTGAPVARVERRHAGYVLEADPDLVDLHRFRRLVEQSRDPRCDDGTRMRDLAEALALWRGLPLAALSGEWVTRVRTGWTQLRLDAAVRWAEAVLRLGRPDDVISALPDLTNDYPHAEPLEALLMRALHAAGRDAEAVARYAAFRERLAGDLGTDPGHELRELHRTLLRGELPAPPRANTTPAQLPADLFCFAGRESELRQLEAMPAEGHTRIVVSGTAGVGKTTLAVHWAQRVRDSYPDGQLYLNLRGFDPTGSPVTPAEAVRACLDAFEVPAERIPAGLAAQVGMYRSVLAGRRVLVVLDNARDAEQVRPLLPGAPGCLVVITSRNQLTGLVTTGAHPLTLGLLTRDEARQLLTRRVGAQRVSAEPEAVDEIVTRCAGLPLALSIVAARAVAHPGFELAAIAGELRGGACLDEFAGADPATDARAVFSWSYGQLSPAAARLFRLLGLHPGPDVAIPAAAGLTGVGVEAVRPVLAELARAHLVSEHVPGRFACHDLLRAYGAELAHAHDTESERAAAMRRVLDHYVHTAYHADRLLNPHPDDEAPPPPHAGAWCPADRAQALAWFTAEHAVLVAAIRQVAGFDDQRWQLARALRRFLSYRGHWYDSVDMLRAAVDAARRLGDPLRRAFAHRFLGCAHVALAHYGQARVHLQRAARLYEKAGDKAGEAHVQRHFAWMLERQGRHREALPHAERALDAFRASGHRAGQARALNAIGWFHAVLGDQESALHHCEQALALQRQLGDRFGQAETWDSLGFAHHRVGHHREAVECYRTAMALYREFDDCYNEADTSASLGDVHLAAGDLESACAAWQHALGILDRLGHPAADDVRVKLKAHR